MLKTFRMLAAAGGLLLATAIASAQAWPTGTIRIIIPAAPGGSSDHVARLVADHLQAALGAAVFLDHRPGAGGIVGTQLLIKSAPDGHTFMLGNIGPQVFAPAMNPAVTYVTARDLVPVGSLVTFGNVMVVNPNVRATNVRELIDLGKASPGKINFGSPGNGQSQHISGEMFKRMAGIDIVHVPYKGTAAATTDLIAGQVQMMFGNIPAALPFIQSGQLRAIAVTAGKRSRMLPNVPTVAESGLPEFKVSSWVALFAPAGTPRAILERVNAEANKAWASPAGQKILAQYDFDSEPLSLEQMSAFVTGETARWSKVIKEANIKAD